MQIRSSGIFVVALVLAVFFEASSIALAREKATASNVAGSVELTATGTVEVLFTPGHDIEGRVAGLIDEAKRDIFVHAYLLTSRVIAEALLRAHQRRVSVTVLADGEQQRRTASDKLAGLAAAGVPVWIEANTPKQRAAHNKVILIDADTRAIILTGSFNWTVAAQRYNSENLLILKGNKALAAQYKANWLRLKMDATKFVP